MSCLLFMRDKGHGFRPCEGTPDGPEQYVMADVESGSNTARVVGSITFKGMTYPIVEHNA